MSNTRRKNMLTSYKGYDANNITFADPKEGTIEENGMKVKYFKIFLGTKNPDGSRGDLILNTPRLFSFGVSESKFGYNFCICLYSQNGPTQEEMEFLKTFEEIVKRCAEHVVDIQVEVRQSNLRTDILMLAGKGGMNPLYYKEEDVFDPVTKKLKGRKRVEGKGPSLYMKLMYNTKESTVTTKFWHASEKKDDGSDFEMSPEELIGQRLYTECALKFESIYVGASVKLQVKLYEAVVEPVDFVKVTRLLRPAPQSEVKEFKASGSIANPLMASLEDETNSLVGDDEPVMEDLEPEVSETKIKKKPALTKQTEDSDQPKLSSKKRNVTKA